MIVIKISFAHVVEFKCIFTRFFLKNGWIFTRFFLKNGWIFARFFLKSAMALLCRYKFPCHPAEMFKSTDGLSNDTRVLRADMVQNIANLSQTFAQKKINDKVFIDIDENGWIIGMDMAGIFGIDIDACVGSRKIPLKSMTVENWKAMKVLV